MGTPAFALPSLRILIERGYEISAIVTTPDKPRGRGLEVSFTPIKEYALSNSISLFQPDHLGEPQFIDTLRSLSPDLIVVVAFRILPKAVYSISKFGAINLHASLLPKYRGAAPINWAIMKGEQETGVTTFFLQEAVDTGSIVLQARLRIGENETAGELHDTLSEVGAEIVLQTVRLIELGKASPRPQEHSNASPAPKIFKADCRIRWKDTALKIHNFVRGLSPYPTAWTTQAHRTLKVYRTRLVDGQSSTGVAGKVIFCDGSSLLIATGDSSIAILEIQQEGRKRMSIEEFLRGTQISVGEQFA